MINDSKIYPNARIMSFDGKDIIKNNKKEEGFNTKKRAEFDFLNLYSGSFDFSLDYIFLKNKNSSLFKIDKKTRHTYTDAIVNVTFKYSIDNTKDNDTYLNKVNELNEVYDKNIKIKDEKNNMNQEIKDIREQIKKIEINIKSEQDKVIKKQLIAAKKELKKQKKKLLDNKKVILNVIKDIKDDISQMKEDKKLIREELIYSTREVREILYRDGFYMNGKHYIRFKRTSGSSRVGKCLFIRKDLYKDIMEWSYMGLKYGENDICDLASLEAYLSLTTSSIIDTMKIKPENILLIDDCKSTFDSNVMAVEYDNKHKCLVTNDKVMKITNKIWDGQSLIDISLIPEQYKHKGFLLLRNRFFKSACFNTNIQKFFEDNNINDIAQIRGTTIAKDIKDIKLITTPSSIKYLKFGSFDTYINKLEETFGIVKYEKPPKHINRTVQTHYQLLNTLPLSKEEMNELLKPTLEYIDLLKNDISVLRKHIGILAKQNEEGSEELINDIDLENCNLKSNADFMYNLLTINDKFADTKLFYDYKQDIIKSFKNNIRKGHIFINGNYSTIISCGFEMLCATIKDDKHEMYFDMKEPKCKTLKINEVHSNDFKFDDEILCCRSPHITMSNLLVVVNKNYKRGYINTYFNSSKFIVHINSIGNNILELANSMDMDGDSMLLTNHKLLVSKAKSIFNTGEFLVPQNLTESETSTRKNCINDKVDLDYKTSKNLIGEIVNLSQILNSKYWDMKSKGANQDELKELFKIICSLAVMSCIEIDKAKRETIVDIKGELDKIRSNDKYISYDIKSIKNEKGKLEEKNVMVRPYFFKFVGEGKNYKFKPMNTPMDYLEKIINKIKKGEHSQDNKNSIMSVIISDVNCNESNRKQIKSIIDNIYDYRIKSIDVWNKNISNEEKILFIKNLKSQINTYVINLNIKETTLVALIKKIEKVKLKSKDNLSEKDKKILLLYRTILDIFFSTKKEMFCNIIYKQKNKIPVLIEVFNEKDDKSLITIYEKTYKKIKIG